jgi:lipid-A-disaccharide synthase-like uncharacterized protein
MIHLPTAIVYSIGFIAQGFFSARILTQWIMSERRRRVVSPVIYWAFSLAGSILLFMYGWLRDDFSIILGQFISYYIYIWNLNIKGAWKKLLPLFQVIIFALPIAALFGLLHDASGFVNSFLHNTKVPIWLLVFGSTGQVIFTIRFIYQWFYSYKRQRSILPVGFWIISLVGSGIIVAYGIFRLDPVLIIGQSVGFIAYIRNIVLFKQNKTKQ